MATQIYVFTSESSVAEDASAFVMSKVNKFLDNAESMMEVKNTMQSESSCVSVYDGMNDWNYSFSITLVCSLRPMADPAKLRELYSSL